VETIEADTQFSLAASGAALAALVVLGLVVSAVNGGTYALIPRTETFVLVWWCLTLCLALGILPRTRITFFLGIALVGLIGFALWTAASLLWTESHERTVIELTRVTGFVGVALGVAWLIVGANWRTASAAVAFAGVAVCGIAIASRLAPGLPTNPLRTIGLAQRLSFPLNYWNALGCWSAMTVGLTLAWSAHAPRWPARGLALAGTCLAAVVIYLTYSRSAAAGAAFATITVVALSRHRWLAAGHVVVAAWATAMVVLAVRAAPQINNGTGGAGAGTVLLVIGLVVAACVVAPLFTSWIRLEHVRLSPRRTREVALAAAVAVVVAAVAVGPTLANRAWHSFESPTPAQTLDPAQRLSTLGGTRKALWQAALDAFDRHPFRGTGAGTYEFVRNRDPHKSFFVRDAHSLYLENLGELGLPGALLIVVALGGLLAGALRTTLRAGDPTGRGAAAGATAALVVFCVTAGVDWMWESTAVTLMALTAGVIAANGGGRMLLARRTLVRRLPVTIGAVIALALQLPVLGAAIQIRTSQRDVQARAFDAATSAATSAIQMSPWGASGYQQRALVLERLGLTAQAAADATRAVGREPTNWEHWLILARIEAERGRVGAAVADARRAAVLNPHAPLFTSQPAARR
jgi:hypothetical protein